MEQQRSRACAKSETRSRLDGRKKARLPENEKEGVNASSVLGKTCRAQKTADDAAYRKKACQKQGAIQTAWQGVISGARETSKGIEEQGIHRPQQRA